MSGRNISKVSYGNQNLIDLTNDTINVEKVLSGYTAHDKTGSLIIGTCNYDANTQNANATANDIKEGKSAYVQGVKIEGAMPNRDNVVGTISTRDEICTFENGYYNNIQVGISATEKAKIISENIKKDINILGVIGNYDPDNDPSYDANAIANEIIENKTAYVQGQKITGTMTDYGLISSYIENKNDIVSFNEGHYDGINISLIADDRDKLVPENIRKGVTILGVTGALDPSEIIIVTETFLRQFQDYVTVDLQYPILGVPNDNFTGLEFGGFLGGFTDDVSIEN